MAARGPYKKASPEVLAARRYARAAAKIEMNRKALDEFQLGMADGLGEMGKRVLDESHSIAAAYPAVAPGTPGGLRDPAAAAERGAKMLMDTGRVIVYLDGKNVGRLGIDVDVTSKPKGMRARKGEVSMEVAYFSKLAHLVELGTIKMPARPFLLPAAHKIIPDARKYVIAPATHRVKVLP